MRRQSAIFSTLVMKVANSGERCASSAAAGYIDGKYQGRGSDALENM
jgi:hypothetical protein